MRGDGLLTLAEAAKYVGVDRVKFSRVAKRLNLPYEKDWRDARYKFFRPEDLERLKSSPTVAPAPVVAVTEGES